MLKNQIARYAMGVAVAALAISSGLPAQAANDSFSTERIGAGQSSNSTVVAQDCIDAGLSEQDCTYTVGVELGSAKSVTASEVMADSGLTTLQKVEILDSMRSASVSSNHWSQFTTGGTYTNTQNGTFYYNGSRVWVTQTYLGYTGSHQCFNNYAIPPSGISNISKSDTGSTSVRDMYCGWNVTNWGVISYFYSMTAQLYPNGTISGFGGTVG